VKAPRDDRRAAFYRKRRHCGVLPIRESVLFPFEARPIRCGRTATLALLERLRAEREEILIVATQRNDEEAPTFDDLHEVGTLARLQKVIPLGPTTRSAVVRGICRVRMRPLERAGTLEAAYEQVHPTRDQPIAVDYEKLRALARYQISSFPHVGTDTLTRIERAAAGEELTDLIAAAVAPTVEVAVAQALLEMADPAARAEELMRLCEERTTLPP
jgi:ATP-dependent Lon protease